MRASHKIVAVLGVITCLVMYVLLRSVVEVAGADASDAPYTGLWVYTPYVGPGERADAKIFLQGGDGVSARDVAASIDGKPAVIEDMKMNERRPGRRYDMGKLEIELSVVVPPDLPPGPHDLELSLEGSCAGSSFSRACGAVHLETTLDVGSTTMRMWAMLRALLAALAVWFGVRRAKRPVLAWVNDAGKSGGVVGSAFIPLFILWGYASYTLFARPLAAGVGTSSDVFFGVAMVAWVVLLPMALVWKRKPSAEQAPSSGAIRFVPEPGSEASGYRDAATKKPTPRTLDDLAGIVRAAFHIRLRRSGNRLVPRWMRGAPISFEAEHSEDITRGALRVRGHSGYVVMCAVKIASELGPLDLELDAKTVRVDRSSSAQSVAQALRTTEK